MYSQFEVQRGLPVSNLFKYFDKLGTGWQVKQGLRDRVVFQEHNLLNDCQKLGRFDIIFCRNVLIYFNERLKSAVLSRLAGQLAMDGYLVLGAAETTSGMSPDFMPVPENHHGIFCLTPDAAAMRRQAKHLHAVPLAATVTRSAEPVAVSDPTVREVKLHQATAEMLEARARARGMTLAELLTEYAVSEAQAGEERPSLKPGRD